MKSILAAFKLLSSFPGYTWVRTYLILIVLSISSDLFSQETYHHNNSAQVFSGNNKKSTGSDLFDVLEYHLDMQIFPSSGYIEASNRIVIEALADLTDNIYLDFSGLVTDSVLIDGKTVLFGQNSDQLLIQLYDKILAGDSAAIEVFYHGQPGKGLYFRTNSYGDTVVYSHNEPYDAKYWIPCKDDPSDKAFFELILKIPQKYISLSNGVIVEEMISGGGIRNIKWRETYPIATYLISLAASPYLLVNQTYSWQELTMPLQYYVYSTDRIPAERGLASSHRILDFFNWYIGIYPFIDEKYAMCAVPFREAAAMENQTATTMRDNIIDNEGVIAHELAHQWWGDALTPQSFEHIWLNEGFASYFDALFTENEYGSKAFEQQMSAYNGYIFQDGSVDYPILNPPPEYLFGRAVYFKGAWVLHMLRNMVGDNIYREINKTYYDLYKYSIVDTDDFIQVCQNQSGRNLEIFFDQWLNFGGIPELFGRWDQNNDEITLFIDQMQPEPLYQMQLEIKIIGESRDSLFVLPVKSRNEIVKFNYSDRISRILIDPENKILQRNNSPLYFLPTTTGLSRLYPNPFNSEITIEFQTDRLQEITIEIWDSLGRRVTIVMQNRHSTGVHSTTWEGKSHASGTYFVVLRTQNQTDVRKVLLLK